MESKRIPEIRFGGFANEWKQEKLRNMADFSKGINYSKSDLTNKGEPVILYGRLYTNYETVIRNIDTYTLRKEKSVVSKGNEVIVPASGESAEDISRASVVAEKGIILGGDLNIITPHEELDSIFLAISISNGKQQKELSRRAQGKSIVHLRNSDLKEANIVFPKKNEQTQIGHFFKQMDDIIILYQHELDNLKQMKLGFFQKMFPKEGETVPELRFPGFFNQWKHYILGDIGTVSMCRRIFKEQTDSKEGIPFFKIGTFGGVPDSFISREVFNEYRSKYPFPENGDVLISASGTIGRTVVYKGEEVYYQDSNIVWLKVNKNKVDNSFLKHLYQVVNWAGVEGSTIKRLYNKSILSTEVFLPSLQEQIQISHFLNRFDDAIDIYHRELELLKQTKKAFLQKMFI